VHSYTKKQTDGSNYGRTKAGITGGGSTERYPRSVLTFKSDKQKSSLHPTQKPVALFEYLIKTYTNEGGLVLYNCMGSGTTAIACLNTNRKYIGFETDVGHYESSLSRIANHCCMLKEVQI
ncbi:TPA: DNA methyltransferase, partial [Listeria monocytogenes]